MVWNWHLDVFCEELQRVFERVFLGLPREYDLIFNVPFGTSKTSVISVLSMGWGWARMPGMRFLSSTHTDSLAQDIATRAKDVVESDKYRAFFPDVVIRRDRAAKEDYANTMGGERKSCTVGGKTPTGRHSHVILVDDPIDPQGARSEVELETASKFMKEVIPSRAVDKAVTPTILVMQRLSPRDPTAVMLEVSKTEGAIPVRQICLPGELTDKVRPPELSERYIDGLLDPTRMPRNVLLNFRAKLGTYAYAGQVLQEPVPPGGGMFKPQWFKRFVRSAPYQATRIRYWDRAATQDGGCYTAGVLMARDAEGSYYVENVEKGQWDPDERNQIIVATAHRDRARYGPNNTPMIVIEAERGSTGLESFRNIARKLAGFRVREDQPTGSKDTRAEPWADQLAAGNVLLVEDGTWDVAGYIEEHILFRPDPTTKRLGKFKDQVDASSGAFNMLAAGSRREGPIFRVLTVGGPKSKGPRLVVCSEEEMRGLQVEERCLLISFSDPDNRVDADLLNGTTTHREREVSDVNQIASRTVIGETLGRTNGDLIPLGKTEVEREVSQESDQVIMQDHRRQVAVAGGEQTSGHCLVKLLDSLSLSFVDLSPEERQDRWGESVSPYGRPPAELVMQREHGKKLWSFLLKKRDPGPEVIVFCDSGDRRATSVAYAVADQMRLLRKAHVLRPADPDNKNEGEAPNRHVYQMTITSRAMVM